MNTPTQSHVNAHTTTHDESRAQIAQLQAVAEQLLARAKAAGASQAEVSASVQQGFNVDVRMGEVETVEATHDRGVAVTVYFGQRKGTASSSDLQQSALEATLAQAVAIAKHTEDDAYAGLADAALMAKTGISDDFDGWHPWDVSVDAAVDLALMCEAAGLQHDTRISNADGTQVASGQGVSVYANSHGFIGSERHTRHSLSCALIAGHGAAMQRDGWYSIGLDAAQLQRPEEVGKIAAERTVARLDARRLPTAKMPVLFSAEVARSLIGHFLSAIEGGAQYRRASFLLDSVGQRLFPEWVQMIERPHLQRGLRSAAFDAEGVATREQALVENGVLAHYLLGSYSARKLGLQSTANAGGVHNLQLSSNGGDFAQMLQRLGNGLLVTELMGQGVNGITGDYSRGAAGFMVENGQISYPVDGITIAGQLQQMFQKIEAIGSDIDPRSHLSCGSILLSEMTVAGE